MRHPELLLPAGSLPVLKIAVLYGADAVYIGGEVMSLRAKAKNFTPEEMREGIAFAHAHGVKVYVTANIFAHNADLGEAEEYFREMKDMRPDALLVADPGMFAIARRICPEIDLHISTQANCTNALAAQTYYDLGASRVVLAREMDLQAVRDIRANIPDDLDIETFVHGSMCMAFSGRCLISNYLTGRDGNHGECAQPCRWKYSLVEEKRPGQVFPIEETAQGTYLFNSQDMNMMEHLDDLIDSGATSLKIEGRSKSAYYVAAMTNAYKSAVNEYMVQRGFEDAEGNELKPFRDRVIRAGEEGTEDDGPDSVTLHADEAFAGMPNWDSAVDEGELSNRQARRTGLERQAEYAEDAGWKHAGVHPAPPVELPDWLREEPGKVAHRDYSTGFYYPEQKVTQNTDRSAYFRDWLVVGEALEWTPEDGGRLTIMSRNKIEPGQLVEILLPGEAPLQYVVPAEGLRDADGGPVALINHPAHVFSLPMPVEVPVNAALRSRTKRPTLKAE